MDYLKEIVERIKDYNKWPEFDRPDFLEELNALADNAISKKSIEGYLTAFLILTPAVNSGHQSPHTAILFS